MVGDVSSCDLSDLPSRTVAEVGCVRLLGVSIPIGGKDAFGTSGLKGQSHPADSAEQIDKLGTVHVIALHL
jgi:hypothetical protein